MHRIMTFQTLKENTMLSTVCYRWHKVYKSIWYTNSFFNTFLMNRYSEPELRKIFQKSKLPLHKAQSSLLEGKSYQQVLKRSIIEAKQSGNNSEGALLSSLKVKPCKQALNPILFDEDIKKICSESWKSLLYLSLNSCGYIGEPSFIQIPKLVNLQLLEITHNP